MPEPFVPPPLEGPPIARALLVPQRHNTELVFVRHGQPTEATSETPRHEILDPPLSDLGVQQADLVAGALASMSLDAIYCSDLRRACQTAAPIAEAHDVEPVVDAALREVEFFRDLPPDVPIGDVMTKEVWRELTVRFSAERTWDCWPHSEGSAAFRERVVDAVDRLAVAHGGRRIAIVCHGGVVNAYVAHVLGVPQDMVFHPAHASVSRVVAREDRRAIWTLNELSHLAAAGADFVTY